MSSARETVIHAAVKLFAERGFEATSINDIEREAGLSVGSGGTYRHFASKKAILEAAIDGLRQKMRDELDPVPASLEDGFRDSLQSIRSNAQLLRIVTRDLDQFPELRQLVIDEFLNYTFQMAADRTEAIAPHLDGEAVATLLGSATVGYVLFETLAEWRPFEIDDDRFIEVLSSVYMNLLTSEPPVTEDP